MYEDKENVPCVCDERIVFRGRTCVIPEIHYTAALTSELSDELASLGAHAREGRGGDVDDASPETESSDDASLDLERDGFIPLDKLVLEDLPEAIRTRENLQLILNVANSVVRVNNNSISVRRCPDHKMGQADLPALKGSGFVLLVKHASEQEQHAYVATARHVLHDAREVSNSSLDFYYDDPHTELASLWTRYVRDAGCCLGLMTFDDNLMVAKYTLRGKPPQDVEFETLFPITKGMGATRSGRDRECLDSERKVVCLVSHPLGKAKHVSFGDIFEEHPDRNYFLHNAPSVAGCTGAPLVVFSEVKGSSSADCFFYHEGTDTTTGLKVARSCSRLVDHLWDSLQETPETCKNQEFCKRIHDSTDRGKMVHVRRNALATVETLSLSAYGPLLGAFILNPDRFSSGLPGAEHIEPCPDLFDVRMKDEEARGLWNHLRKLSGELEGNVQKLPDDSDLFSDADSFVSWLGCCYCQHVVQAVAGKTASAVDHETFLRPDIAPAMLSSKDTWPWSQNLSGGSSNSDHDRARCILAACLNGFGKSQDKEIEALLILIIAEANNIVRKNYERSLCNPSGKKAEKPHDEYESEMRQNSEKMQVTLKMILNSLLVDCSWIHDSPWNELEEKLDSRQDLPPHLKSFRITVHQVQHIRKHHTRDLWADQPPPNTGNMTHSCMCSRPRMEDFAVAARNAQIGAALKEAWMKQSKPPRQMEERMKEKRALKSKHADEEADLDDQFFCRGAVSTLLKEALVRAEEQRNSELSYLLTFASEIDSTEHFSRRHDILTLGTTALEVLLFNSMQFLRLCKQDLQPLWLSQPVSVFGRPGHWPGNRVPLSVRNTAWRLARASCLHSRYGRDVLEALEGNPEQRAKLIDLYVDMKQLKFAGEIDVRGFTCQALRCLQTEKKVLAKASLQTPPVDSSAAAYVMRTFLDIVTGVS